MSVKAHYDTHLGYFYAWMSGDFDTGQKEFLAFLQAHQLASSPAGRTALDLGAGHGIQSVALAQLGYQVQAVDFNKQLLAELEINRGRHLIHIHESDLRDVKQFAALKPALILCWGDTVLHLETRAELIRFIKDCFETLDAGGKLVLSFRDYSVPLEGVHRFIPVKSDNERLLTCCLDYGTEQVQVTDILHYRENGQWRQKVSAYHKLRILPPALKNILDDYGFQLTFDGIINRFVTLIAHKL